MSGNKDISIVLCGEAGQGIETIERLLTKILKTAGFNIFAAKEYMSRVRGGSNSTLIRVSSQKVSGWTDQIDVFVPLNDVAGKHLQKRISEDTVVLSDFKKIAAEAGNELYANTVAIGMISGLFRIDREIIVQSIKENFSKKEEEVIRGDIEAATKGYRLGLEISASGKIQIDIPADYQIKKDLLISGAESIALGALAGGLNFLSSYPMTPGTGVFTALAKYSKDFEVVVEQAEDEISAINMALGAWYAGARAMVTTSGGGFALMVEGVSLSGMLETPVVIHLGQRPGPATGLPTRTEQADLNFALYSGHGEFPRIILTPGTIEDAFYLSQQAFNLADKFQVPVFILTDQYLVDSYQNLPLFDLVSLRNEQYIVETKADYKRYKIMDNGISPRGIPGFGEGLVLVDSDEHDENGNITEDLDLRTKMVNKRLKKLELIRREIIPPQLFGSENYKTLVVGWGSTCNVIKEALLKLDRKDIAFLYFKQVYPLFPMIGEYLKEAEKTVIIENNATSQFGQLIKLHTGRDFDQKILKYNGLPFSVEEITEALNVPR